MLSRWNAANLRYKTLQAYGDDANKPEPHNKAQHLVDASVNYYYKDWYFSLLSRNLLEEDGYQIGFDVAGLLSYAAPRATRAYGFEIGFSYGD